MIYAPSSTWFTSPTHWGWLITLYFFFGGLAGGSYLLAALIDVFGRREDRHAENLNGKAADWFKCFLHRRCAPKD